MKRSWLRALVGRRIVIFLLLILQAALMVYIVISSSRTSQIIDVSLRLVSAFVALFMINREMNASYKLAWIFMILLLPLFGGLFYLTCVCQASTRRFKKDVTAIDARCKHYLKPEPDCLNELADAGKAVSTARYLQNCAGFPLCKDTETQFLCPGERFFEAALRELEQAKRYIFLEYYIIRDGEMWNAVLEILKRKAAEGVDVRVLYDDFGCFLSFSRRYRRYLQECGIKCRVFNSFRPILTTVQNNRDHRKIMVIDGRVGFTGGINLADEYINRDSPLGHWKDAAILLRGNAVKNLVGIFFSLWYRRGDAPEDETLFLPEPCGALSEHPEGYCIPFSDSPMDRESVGERVYLQMINHATRYINIATPYLVIDDGVMEALTAAAKGGIDVRVMVPARGDNPLVQRTMRSYFRRLLRAGVKLYEYTPGFVHAKTIVTDDECAVVGTITCDYRSLYLQVACGGWMYKTAAVAQVRDDFLKDLPRCRALSEADCRKNVFSGLVDEILRLFAPLM